MTSLQTLAVVISVSGFLGLTTAPATAQSGLEKIVRIEVLDGGMTERGTHRAALRVVLAKGWKTYWRVSGDSGIPPQFDWGDSSNVEEVSVSWPTPVVFEQYGLYSIGYTKQMVLPLEITATRPGQPMRLKGEIEFGVCEEICVPARLNFDQALDPAAPGNPVIAAALAEQPLSASEAGVGTVTCRLTSTGDGSMQIETQITMPSAGDPEVTVIEPGDEEIWASEATSQRRGNVLTSVSELFHISGTDFELDRAQIRITVLGKSRAVDIRGCSAG